MLPQYPRLQASRNLSITANGVINLSWKNKLMLVIAKDSDEAQTWTVNHDGKIPLEICCQRKTAFISDHLIITMKPQNKFQTISVFSSTGKVK